MNFRSEGKNSTLRIKARNLRAKVRSLLPLDICCKYQQRNARMRKLQHKRLNWLKKSIPPHQWTNTQDSQPHCYFQNYTQGEPKHMFSKLSEAQIQQICSHKHYFIGEAHIKEFEDFLSPKTANTEPKSSPKIAKSQSKLAFVRSLDPEEFRRWERSREIEAEKKIGKLEEDRQNILAFKRTFLELRIKNATKNVTEIKDKITNRQKVKRGLWDSTRQRVERIHEQTIENNQISSLTEELRKICSYRSSP